MQFQLRLFRGHDNERRCARRYRLDTPRSSRVTTDLRHAWAELNDATCLEAKPLDSSRLASKDSPTNPALSQVSELAGGS